MEQSKIIDTLETYQASPSLIPARPRVGKWEKENFWCGMLPSIIYNVIFFVVAWMFRSKWFKINVHIDIRVIILQAY